jgi:hypothetical protein
MASSSILFSPKQRPEESHEALPGGYDDRIEGILSGFDRVVFRGSLTSINYPAALQVWLNSQGILLQDCKGKFKELSKEIKEGGKALAEQQKRPYRYIWSPAADGPPRNQLRAPGELFPPYRKTVGGAADPGPAARAQVGAAAPRLCQPSQSAAGASESVSATLLLAGC